RNPRRRGGAGGRRSVLRSTLRRLPELSLDAVARLEVLERLLRGLKLMRRAIRLPDGDLALGLVHRDHLALDRLRGLHLPLGIAGRLALPERRPCPQHERDGEPPHQAWPHSHASPPLLLVVLIDVVDRPGRGAHPRTDQRALAGAIPRTVSDRRTGPRTHRSTGRRPAACEGKRDHPQAEDPLRLPLHHDALSFSPWRLETL